jgi:heme/copper-type cytochrome/quinol oxidase subunit 4
VLYTFLDMDNSRYVTLTMVAVIAGFLLAMAVVTGLSLFGGTYSMEQNIIGEAYAIKQSNTGSGE